MFSPDVKKGSAALLVLALVEERPRHGYEISKLIESRSGGALTFRVASLYPMLYRLEKRGGSKGAGSRRPDSAGGAITSSHEKDGASCRGSDRSGSSSSGRWIASRASARPRRHGLAVARSRGAEGAHW
jgi:hypothetical protein